MLDPSFRDACMGTFSVNVWKLVKCLEPFYIFVNSIASVNTSKSDIKFLSFFVPLEENKKILKQAWCCKWLLSDPKGDHLTYKYNQTFQTVLDLMMIY